MKGSVYHNKTFCKSCGQGDRNTIKHPSHYIQLSLPYLRPKPFKLSGKDKGRPFKDGIDAYIYLREIQEAIQEKEFIPWNYRRMQNSICQFGNFFEKFKAVKYDSYRKYFSSFWDKDLQEIDRIQVKRFYRNLPENLSQSTKNLILKILRAIFSEAFSEGYINIIPAFPRKDKARKPTKQWLTREEQKAVIKAIPQKYQPIFIFLACHGKRVSEALSLRWEDIDFKKKIFKIYESKVKEETLLPLHQDFLDALPVSGTINKTGKIFSDCYYETLQRTLKRACKKADVKIVSTHEFGRHSFITQRLNSGFTREQVGLVTNNLSSINKYAHVDFELIRKVIQFPG